MIAKPITEPSRLKPRPLHLWLRFLGFYAAFSLVAHLVWEVLQLPLYTLRQTEPPSYVLFAVLHCTAGDLLIGSTAFLVALPVTRASVWPPPRFAAFAVTAITTGVGYTIYSEWLNVFVRKSWAYSEWMPLVPGTGIGLSPILQWLVVPTLALGWAYRAVAPRSSDAVSPSLGGSHAGW